MKKIFIKCFNDGTATVKSSKIHLDNENLASKIVIDFSETEHADKNKWLDVISGGSSYRYDLGTDEVVNYILKYENTIAGELILTPFVYDGMIKEKYKIKENILIYKQEEAGVNENPVRDDYVFEIRKDVDMLMNNIIHIGTLYDGDTITKDLLVLYNMIMILFSTTTGVRKSVNFRLKDISEDITIKEAINADTGAYFEVNSDNYEATFSVEGDYTGKCEVYGIGVIKDGE